MSVNPSQPVTQTGSLSLLARAAAGGERDRPTWRPIALRSALDVGHGEANRSRGRGGRRTPTARGRREKAPNRIGRTAGAMRKGERPMTTNSPQRAGEASRAVYALPGVTLMELTDTVEGLHVRCPGCCAQQVVAPGFDTPPVFVHADRGCPVLRAIDAAFEAFRDTTEVHA